MRTYPGFISYLVGKNNTVADDTLIVDGIITDGHTTGAVAFDGIDDFCVTSFYHFQHDTNDKYIIGKNSASQLNKQDTLSDQMFYYCSTISPNASWSLDPQIPGVHCSQPRFPLLSSHSLTVNPKGIRVPDLNSSGNRAFSIKAR